MGEGDQVDLIDQVDQVDQVNLIDQDGNRIDMSKRKGQLVTLNDLLDQLAEAVDEHFAVDVARYFFLNRTNSSHLDFDLPLFDYIHSLDNLKLAEKIADQQLKLKKEVKIFIQVNIDNESQKNGIETQNLESFYKKCIDDFNLKIIGIMCIPPNDNLSVYFSKMRELSDNFKFSELSMGMSNDYLSACEYKSTFLRIGSKIFGSRN